MMRKISQRYPHGYFTLTFDDETEIVQYYKDGFGECAHDVNISLIQDWAKEHGYHDELDLFTFMEYKLKDGLADDFMSMVEDKTKASWTWISMDDMGD